jgi:hypothetical protein
MFGDAHIIKVAEATDSNVSVAIYKHLLSRFSRVEQEEFAVALAAATAMWILGRDVPKPEHKQFRSAHIDRIEKEAASLQSEPRICEILSGAAYNMGYGHYVASGGGRINNRFLGFIRLERNLATPSDAKLLADLRHELNQRSPDILITITSLEKIGLWRSRSHNPNEVDYLNAVRVFANEQ